ncbi:MAG: hypothetical protein JWR59_1162 [Brevundimonas sp.]|nr:hypothetical protein [Brevundimonas sp.]
MITTVTPSGSGANFRLMIRNTDAMPITLEITPYRVAVDDAGIATRTPEAGDVILFPPQTIVQPGGEQAIQVRYIGEPAVAEGRLYAIVVSQLPVDFTKVTNSDTSETQVKIGFDFVSHMVVQPAAARATLTISPVTRQANGDLSFEISNTGNGVALLRNAEWKLTPSSGQPLIVPSDNISFGAFGAILPGGRRSVTITAANAPGMTGVVTAAITLK